MQHNLMSLNESIWNNQNNPNISSQFARSNNRNDKNKIIIQLYHYIQLKLLISSEHFRKKFLADISPHVKRIGPL